MKTPPTTNGPSQSGIQQISRTALSTTHATPTIRKSPRCDMENNKALHLDSHSQTPKLLAKPREKQQQKHKTKRNKNKRNRTISVALPNKIHPLCKTGYHRQVEKHPRTKSKTNLRSETEKHNNHVETCRKSTRALRAQTPRH